MNRFKEMDKFLKKVYKKYKKNPNDVSPEYIYGLLESYDIPEKEYKTIRNDKYFNEWIDTFKNSNLQVYHTELQPGFLQFSTGADNKIKCIKLYVNLKPAAIEEGVKAIFGFISNNKMKSQSKVANRLRSDQIVIRLESKEDADKVINFINNQEFFRKNARLTNPFVSRNGCVGIAYDDKLSYNQFSSEQIYNYITSTNKPSYEDFTHYIEQNYQDIFVRNNYKKLTDSKYFQENYNRINGIKIYDNISPFDYVINNCDEVEKVFYTNLRTDSYDKLFSIIPTPNISEDKTRIILRNYITYANSKYHDLNEVITYLSDYVQGNINAITRDNNYRDYFKQLNPSHVYSLMNGDISAYVNSVVNANEDTQEIKPTEEDLNKFIIGCKRTYEAYGELQLKRLIPEMEKGNIEGMTNNIDYCRDYFEKKYKQSDLPYVLGMIINYLNNKYIDYINNGQDLTYALAKEYGFQSYTR